MSVLDFNNAGEQRASGGLIPKDTTAFVVLSVRPGGQGEGGWLKANKDGSCLMLDLEFTVDGGPYDRRKFWTYLVVEGETDGQKEAANISRSKLRAILESARGVSPTDTSDAAIAARRASSYADFDVLRFPTKIDVEKGKAKNDGSGERYDDKNALGVVLTPGDEDYLSPGPQRAPQAAPKANPASSAPKANKPAWAA